MSTEVTPRAREVSSKRLWFGLSAAALSWMGLGIADVLITWRECLHRQPFEGPGSNPGLHALNIVLFVVLLIIAIVAGVMSYRNWRRLAGEIAIHRAEAYGAREYLALLGVFVSVTLGLGIIWFGIPLLILTLCVRTR